MIYFFMHSIYLFIFYVTFLHIKFSTMWRSQESLVSTQNSFGFKFGLSQSVLNLFLNYYSKNIQIANGTSFDGKPCASEHMSHRMLLRVWQPIWPPQRVFYIHKNLFHSPSFRSPFNSLPQFDPRTVVSSLRKERRKKEVENDDQKEMTKK